MDAALRHRLYDIIWMSEVSFNPCFDGCRPATSLISLRMIRRPGFNPCFDGCRPATITWLYRQAAIICFNPCFDGCRPATCLRSWRTGSIWDVSILVLMDAALRHKVVVS